MDEYSFNSMVKYAFEKIPEGDITRFCDACTRFLYDNPDVIERGWGWWKIARQGGFRFSGEEEPVATFDWQTGVKRY